MSIGRMLVRASSYHRVVSLKRKLYSTLSVFTQEYEWVPVTVRETPEGGTLPSNRLMGTCRWMGSHFHDWIDYNGVAFSMALLEWGRIFSGFWGRNILASSKFGYQKT